MISTIWMLWIRKLRILKSKGFPSASVDGWHFFFSPSIIGFVSNQSRWKHVKKCKSTLIAASSVKPDHGTFFHWSFSFLSSISLILYKMITFSEKNTRLFSSDKPTTSVRLYTKFSSFCLALALIIKIQTFKIKTMEKTKPLPGWRSSSTIS